MDKLGIEKQFERELRARATGINYEDRRMIASGLRAKMKLAVAEKSADNYKMLLKLFAACSVAELVIILVLVFWK